MCQLLPAVVSGAQCILGLVCSWGWMGGGLIHCRFIPDSDLEDLGPLFLAVIRKTNQINTNRFLLLMDFLYIKVKVLGCLSHAEGVRHLKCILLSNLRPRKKTKDLPFV